MPRYAGSSASTFPQTSKNRTLDELEAELADFTGGKLRDDIKDRARRSIFEAVRVFNYTYWTFNLQVQDHTLVAGTDTYTMNASFLRQHRAQMVDSSDKTREEVEWIPWELWSSRFPSQNTTGSIPLFYTARNLHETGQIIVDPVPASTLTYPTLRTFYFRQIDCPSNGNDIIECPSRVEQAIMDEAIYRFIRKVRGFRDAREARTDAILSRAAVEREYRAYEDYHGA